MYARPKGDDVARLSDTRNVTRTATGLEDVTPADETTVTEPVDYDDVPAKARKPAPPPNRAQRRAMQKWAKSKEGKAAMARARAERQKQNRSDGKD